MGSHVIRVKSKHSVAVLNSNVLVHSGKRMAPRSRLRPSMEKIGLAVLALAATVGAAGSSEKSYRQCQITNGQVASCGTWYQGSAVTYRDEAYRLCKIFNGQASSCGGWYQGKAVVYRDGAYRECRIFNGQASSCGGWYQGKAVVNDR